jgi:hypothetical protein
MTTLTLRIKKRNIERELSKMAKEGFEGDKEKAALRLLEDGIEKRRTKGKKRIDLNKSKFVGMWADREDMKNSVAWVNTLREKEARRRVH